VAAEFTLEGSTVPDIQKAINQGLLTSKKLLQMYLDRIAAYDRHVHG
jgi:Asp-tRNA(Asn)/Glu-tRNA(Gln) amidotransferase A subunit family amidase